MTKILKWKRTVSCLSSLQLMFAASLKRCLVALISHLNTDSPLTAEHCLLRCPPPRLHHGSAKDPRWIPQSRHNSVELRWVGRKSAFHRLVWAASQEHSGISQSHVVKEKSCGSLRGKNLPSQSRGITEACRCCSFMTCYNCGLFLRTCTKSE